MTTLLQIPPRNVRFLSADGTVSDIWYKFLLNVVARMGGISGGVQAADDTLTALAGLNATPGLVVETAADAFAKRSLAGVSGNTVVTHADGSDGNPTVDLAPVSGVAGTHASPTSITVDGFGRITGIS